MIIVYVTGLNAPAAAGAEKRGTQLSSGTNGSTRTAWGRVGCERSHTGSHEVQKKRLCSFSEPYQLWNSVMTLLFSAALRSLQTGCCSRDLQSRFHLRRPLCWHRRPQVAESVAEAASADLLNQIPIETGPPVRSRESQDKILEQIESSRGPTTMNQRSAGRAQQNHRATKQNRKKEKKRKERKSNLALFLPLRNAPKQETCPKRGWWAPHSPSEHWPPEDSAIGR